jgi:hypothetical protein
VTGTARVLDTGALLSYAAGESAVVGATLLAAAERGLSVAVPVTCVAEAYQSASAEVALMLDLLFSLPAVRVVALQPADGATVGGIAKAAGRLGLAHACLITMVERIAVMTAEPATALEIIEDYQLVWGV